MEVDWLILHSKGNYIGESFFPPAKHHNGISSDSYYDFAHSVFSRRVNSILFSSPKVKNYLNQKISVSVTFSFKVDNKVTQF